MSGAMFCTVTTGVLVTATVLTSSGMLIVCFAVTP